MLTLIKTSLEPHTRLCFIINGAISQLRFYNYNQMLYYSSCFYSLYCYYEIKIRKSYINQVLTNLTNCSLL